LNCIVREKYSYSKRCGTVIDWRNMVLLTSHYRVSIGIGLLWLKNRQTVLTFLFCCASLSHSLILIYM
jgi:hypothetical protein